MNADANSSVDRSIWGGIERGLNDLTGGASRRILLSPEFTRALNAIDGFFAGVADSLTAGLSTRLRTAMWGETATQNHTGGWFLLGQGVGAVLGRHLLAVPAFVRHVVVDRWFLHRHDAALAPAPNL